VAVGGGGGPRRSSSSRYAIRISARSSFSGSITWYLHYRHPNEESICIGLLPVPACAVVYKNAQRHYCTIVCTFPTFYYIINWWRHQFSMRERSLNIKEKVSTAVYYVHCNDLDLHTHTTTLPYSGPFLA
jgi:hypothetical protein